MTSARLEHGSAELLAFLRTKRWFGDKARRLRAVTVRDSIPVEWPNSDKPFSVLRLDVEADEGTSTYQAFIERGTGRLNDALEDPDFRRGLIDAFVRDLSFEDAGVRWRFRSESKGVFVAPPGASIRLASGEQSNSSVIVDGQAILKLFRRLEAGIHPDVEVTRFLTIDRQFVHVPVLLGTVVFEDARGTTTAGMLQELVPDAVDAWTYALTASRTWFSGRGDAGKPPFVQDAEQLGRITRELHETLATGDRGSAFERRAVDDQDLRDWTTRTTEMIRRATTSLARAIAAGNIAGSILEQARMVAEAGSRFSSTLAERTRAIGADRGAKTRTHGDYHLGQVIRSSANQFLVIDFEGEPARPLSERRAHHSPLRDVAGMLRSFAYAAAVSAAEGGSDTHERSRRWEQQVRDAFLRGYFNPVSEAAAILPSKRENAERLIALFETEKTFYELQYELDHRPEWVWIPLSGIAEITT